MTVKKKYRLYVFDLDGTIADTRKDIGRAFTKVIEKQGFGRPSDKEVTAAIGRGAKIALKKLTGIEEDSKLETLVELFIIEYDKICADNVTLYEGARELLFRLKNEGALLALVTMKAKNSTWKIIKEKGIDIFNEVVTYDDTEKRKPDPETLLNMFEKYSLKPDMALMTGDSITDMKYAKAAGVDFCVVEHGYGDIEELKAHNPNYILKSLLDF